MITYESFSYSRIDFKVKKVEQDSSTGDFSTIKNIVEYIICNICKAMFQLQDSVSFSNRVLLSAGNFVSCDLDLLAYGGMNLFLVDECSFRD